MLSSVTYVADTTGFSFAGVVASPAGLVVGRR
jgi:hypothetical protein